jgi:hypothetical protein
MDTATQRIINDAKLALQGDIRSQLAAGSQQRNAAFKQLNEKANASHMMFSGMPMGTQMAYDQNTFIPNMASAVVKGVQTQIQNQESWDDIMAKIKELTESTAQYKKAMGQ